MSHESLRVNAVCREKRLLARRKDVFGSAVVHHRRGHQADPGVAMLVIVVAEEVAAESPGVLNAPEAFRKLRAILHGLELRFRERIVIGDVRS